MIYLIDHVLPDSYFANNLRALSVDMAVFRDLLQWKFPPLSRHLDNLQRAAQEEASGDLILTFNFLYSMTMYMNLTTAIHKTEGLVLFKI